MILPLHVLPPFEGCDGEEMEFSVWDADGTLIAECFDGDDRGRRSAVAIATAINRDGPQVCAVCEAPATCFGSYEDGLSPGYACDDCCGHGCEDGHCDPVASLGSKGATAKDP